MKFLYKDGSTYHFMNMEDFEQIELVEDQIKEQVKYLKDDIKYYEDDVITNNDKYFMISELVREPAIKGNTATNATKDAIVETGMLVRVPLFIEEGEEIIVSTRDGKYVSRK